MIISHGIVGSIDMAEGGTEKLDFIDVHWLDAGKRLLRQQTQGGLDFALSMQRFQYLFHGAVLYRGEDYTVVVRRPEEPALIIDLSETWSVSDVVRRAALIGHAFGNQHAPIEVHDGTIVVPMLTSEELMTKTIRDLKLGEISLRFDCVRVGATQPLFTLGHAHE